MNAKMNKMNDCLTNGNGSDNAKPHSQQINSTMLSASQVNHEIPSSSTSELYPVVMPASQDNQVILSKAGMQSLNEHILTFSSEMSSNSDQQLNVIVSTSHNTVITTESPKYHHADQIFITKSVALTLSDHHSSSLADMSHTGPSASNTVDTAADRVSDTVDGLPNTSGSTVKHDELEFEVTEDMAGTNNSDGKYNYVLNIYSW